MSCVPEFALGSTPTIVLCYEDQDGTVVPIDTASTQEVVVKGPTGVAKTFTTTFLTDGLDGKAKYKFVVTADLDEPGVWLGQGNLVIPGGYTGRSTQFRFKVTSNL